jgi:outer membrane receptor protein involved in Fe transport
MQKSTHRFCTGKRMPYRMAALFVFMVGCTPFLVKAQSYKSLTDKIQLAAGKTNAAAVVKSLQQQTAYTFIYDPEYLKQCALTAMKFENAPLSTVLQYLDNNAPLDIELTNSNTIAVRKGNAERPAARNNGRVAGKVVDNKNEPLPGVTIQVQGGQGVVSNIDGSYELQLDPGKYTLIFSYISFESRKVTDVIVNAAGVTPLNILLRNNGSRLKEVTITGNYRKASIEGLYALQKNNASITDGISSEQIARTPDKNLGEVLKRVSGLATVDNKYVVVRGLSERYNQAVLNGQVMPSTELNRKNFSFDVIPSNMVENVTVVKTLTPDRSAEFGGGLVEVNTLDIPTENFLNMSIGAGYNDKTTGKDFLSLPLDGSEYRGSVARHRYLMGTLDWKSKADIVAHYGKSDNSSSQFSNNWGVTKFKAPVSPNYQVSLGRVLNRSGQQWGVIASGSYRNTLATQDITFARDGFSQSEGAGAEDRLFKGQRYGFTTNVNGMLGVGFRNERNRVSFQSLYMRTLDQQLILGKGQNDFGPNTLGLYDLTTQTTMWQNQLKGEHSLGHRGVKFKWLGSYIMLDRQRPDNHRLLGDYKQADSTSINDYNISRAGSSGISAGSLRWWSRALENNYTWDAAVSVPFRFNAGQVVLDNTFKGGYAGWSKHRLFYVLNTGSNIDNANGYYFPLAKFYTPENNTRVDIDRADRPDDFDKTASLHAVYAMLDNKIGSKWRLVWGLRAEYYNLNKVNANLDSLFSSFKAAPGEELDYSALLNREPNWHFFPSANLTYSLTPSMNLRMAYAESIIRPDLRELSFFREYDFDLGGEYLGGLVRSTTIKNFDLRYEWYPGPGEILSASLFYKVLDNPMEIYKEGSNRVFYLRNNKQAKNYGVEVEVRKSLAFTGVPVVRNITLYGNVTYLDATVTPMTISTGIDPDNKNKVIVTETLGEKEKRPQTGASNYMINAGFYYDVKPFSLSLVYNTVANRMYRPSVPYVSSLFERPLQALDAQIAVRMLKNKAELKVNVANILNSFSVIYENTFNDDPEVGMGKKDPSKSQLGYQSGKDLLDYKAYPGRTFSATFSYRF